jgi:hypothetical protein
LCQHKEIIILRDLHDIKESVMANLTRETSVQGARANFEHFRNNSLDEFPVRDNDNHKIIYSL